jgi:hypothetical protein
MLTSAQVEIPVRLLGEIAIIRKRLITIDCSHPLRGNRSDLLQGARNNRCKVNALTDLTNLFLARLLVVLEV